MCVSMCVFIRFLLIFCPLIGREFPHTGTCNGKTWARPPNIGKVASRFVKLILAIVIQIWCSLQFDKSMTQAQACKAITNESLRLHLQLPDSFSPSKLSARAIKSDLDL